MVEDSNVDPVGNGTSGPLCEFALDAKLETLRKQIGKLAWQERICKARAREQAVLQATALLEDGTTLAEAARSCGQSSTTLGNWITRYRENGLPGLIDRTGRSKLRDDPLPLVRSSRRRRTGPSPVSFIKWAGSKRSVMPHLLRFVPHEYATFYEPMVGSGTVFLTLRPARAVLGDVNTELMDCYDVLRSRVEDLIATLGQHVNSYEHYIAVRALDPVELPPVERAARLIYLNKTCYNGLYRVNSRGRFNVPYGRADWANICDAPTLRRISKQLQGVELRTGGFRDNLRGAGAGDFVYLDPPYLVPGTRGARCHRYQPEAFDEEAHLDLAQMFRDLDHRGCHVMLSNSNVPMVRTLYDGYHIEVLPTRRKIHFAADKRDGFTEVLVSNQPPTTVQPRQLGLFTA
jgi:DNA adenine methylase